MLLIIAICILLLGSGALVGLLIWAIYQDRPQPGPRRHRPEGSRRASAGPRLRVVLAGGQTRDIALRPGQIVTIGRESDNLVVIDDPLVSRRHARLFFEGDQWFVQDRQSANGTFVN